MTREVKIGTAVAGSFLSLVGIVVGTKMYKGDVPKNLESAIAAVTGEPKKDGDAPKPAPANPPGPLTLVNADTVPLKNDSLPPLIPPPTGLPSVSPPPPGGGLPSLPPPSTEIGFPPAPPPNLTAPFKDAANDVAKNLADQRDRELKMLRDAADKKKAEFANTGNAAIDNVRKNVDQFATGLQNKTKDAIDGLPSLPALPDNGFSLPPIGPVTVADNTIVGKKPNPPADRPSTPLPPPGGLPTSGLPTIPEAPKTIVGGGGTPPPPPAGLPTVTPEPKIIPKQPPPPFTELPVAPPPEAKTIVGGNTPSAKPPTVPFIAPADNPPFGGISPVEKRPEIPPPTGNPFAANPPPNAGFPPPPPPPTDPLVAPVRTDTPERYQCQGNENYALIATRKYGNDALARALEAYNRDLPGAAANVVADPPRLQAGTIVFLPSPNYLHERYGRFVGMQQPLQTPPGGTPRTDKLGDEIGLRQPVPFTPAKNPPTTPAQGDAGVTTFRVPTGGMYLSQVAERQLGSALRWIEIYRLNPGLQPEQPLREDTVIRIPMK